jgi:predicted AAA+ superfamily ATPase
VSTDREKKIEEFYNMVEDNIESGMHYRDAIELSAVTVGGLIPAKVSHAMAKYQEAIHPQSHLSQEENKDALALLSMGVLWDNMYFNPIEMDVSTDLENTVAESIYFIMKYAGEEDGLVKALEANIQNVGDVESRAKAICRVLGKV